MDIVKSWEHCGLQCFVIKTNLGNLNGYVSIPSTHPWHGVGYSVCARRVECRRSAFYCDHSPAVIIDVHGGITFGGYHHNGMWTFGFDTAHSGDCVPALFKNGHLWTIDEVTEETESMALQLREVGKQWKLLTL